uniref:DNAJC9 HTH domain-containing protein n=1 Tax=Naja naja TaxID=35670 RepID=A0A8C6YAT2_NAJNA
MLMVEATEGCKLFQELTAFGKPKKNRSPFNIYISEHFQEIEGTSNQEKFKILCEEWKTLPSFQKQILGKVYAVLSDEEQRTLYDQQGIVDEESTVLTQDCNWEEYWRLLFKKITVKNIKDFEKKYKHSTEELEDVKAAYEDFKGDMDKIMESVLCVDYTDEPRIRQIIQHAIDSGELPSYKSFVNESKRKINARKRKAEKEAKEAEESREQMGLDEGDDDLKVLIQSRMDSRKKEMEDFVARMEAKYADKSKKGGKKATAKK